MSGPAPSIQYAWDGPGTLGAGQDGYALVWSQSQGKFIAATAGVTDHGALSGLADDDHPQYALLAGRSGGQTIIGGTASGNNLTLTSTAHATQGQVIVVGRELKLPDSTSGDVPSMRFGTGAVGAGAAGIGGITTTLYVVANSVKRVTFNGSTTQFQNSIVTINAGASTWQSLIVKGAASQSANLQEWQDSAGTVLAHITATGSVGLGQQITFGTANPVVYISGGGTLTVKDGSSQTLATFIHGAGGTLRNAGTTRIEWNATGIGFFAATPVAKAAALTAADASALNTGDATSDTVIANIRTRLGELESRLQAYGLLT